MELKIRDLKPCYKSNTVTIDVQMILLLIVSIYIVILSRILQI